MNAAPLDPASAAGQRTLRELAEEAARLGGAVARGYFRRALTIRLKPDRSEVSDADEAAQAAIIRRIRATRPADAFITEETQPAVDTAGTPPPLDAEGTQRALDGTTAAAPPAPSNQRVCWIIDPIDGTRNFVRGIPIYACSVAAMFGGFPVAGAICDPQRGVLYSASRAEALFVDGAPASATPDPQLARLNPVVGIPSQPAGPAAAVVRDWVERYVCRNLGATALHLALVATGELDAMLADNPRLWDIAAGWVLVTAAGGRATSPFGEALFPLDVAKYHTQKLPTLAARAALHERLVAPQPPQ